MGADDSGDDDGPDYEVGYGRPPRATQWRPGQSGNPSGKKKGKTLAQEIAAAGDTEKMFLSGGEPVMKSLREAAAEQVYINAAKGNNAAAKLVLEAEERAIGEVPAEGLLLLGPEELEVAQTHAEWLALIQAVKTEPNDDPEF